MGDASFSHLADEGRGNVVLADELIKGLGSIFAIEGLILHGRQRSVPSAMENLAHG